MQQIFGVVIGLLVAGTLFFILERRFAALPEHRLFARERLADVGWWFFNGTVTRFVSRIAIALPAIAILAVSGSALAVDDLRHGWGPVGALPGWAQVIGMLLLADFLSYWIHRLKHRQPLWRFHAIHHSSETLDWLAAGRVHPVDDIVSDLARALVLLGIGFAPMAIAALAPVLLLAAIGVHANLRWDWGPLRYVVVSPAFHRWHHTSEEEGRDCNFAGLLPLWDLLFGTYFLPDRPARRFGVDEPVPKSLWGQLRHPFRRRATAERASERAVTSG